MKKQFLALLIVCAFLITACGAGLSAQPTATLSPPTATLPPTLTSTPEPTFTPTATSTPRLPVSLGTQIPAPGLAISADNLDQVVELARWGRGVITDAVYSPDGKFIAVATTLGVSVYQADTLEEEIYFETNAIVNSIAFSPDGETLATSLNDNTLKIWRASDGTLLGSFESQKDETSKADEEEMTSVAFSPDGNLLATGSSDGIVSLWQISDISLVLTPKAQQTRWISSVFFSPDGQSLFSSSYDGTVYMRQVSDGELLRTFGGTAKIDATLSADGKILATSDYGDQSSLILWDVESGEKIQTIAEAEKYSFNYITSLAFSPDSLFVAAAWRDNTAKIWSVASGAPQSTLEDLRPKDGNSYYSWFAVAFSPDNQTLLMAGSDVIGIWDVKKSTLLTNAKIKSEEINDIALSPDGQTLASVEGPNINLWQFPDGSLRPSQELMQSNGNVDFSPDGATLLALMFDNTAWLWPLSDQGARRTFEMEKKEAIQAVAISPDGKTLVLGGFGEKVEIRQISDGSLLRTINLGGQYNLGEMAFSSNGEFLAVLALTARNNQIKVFQVSDGKLVKSFVGGASLAFSPDGTLLVGGTPDKTITVWKMPSGETSLTIKDQSDEVNSVIFSPDGTLLASGSADGTIEIFLASDGTLLKSWKGHSYGISDLIFTSDGKLLISSSYDGTIRMWGIKP